MSGFASDQVGDIVAMLKTVITAFAAAALASPALAQDFEFDYHKDELSNARAADAMYDRLADRVESYCTTPGRKALTARAQEEACIRTLMDDAVDAFDDPRMDRLSARRNGARDFARDY